MIGCASHRIRKAVSVNIVLGVLTSWFIYLSAVNFERGALALDASGDGDGAESLRIASFMYYAIALLVLNHSIYFLHYDHSRRDELWKAKKKLGRSILLCQCYRRTTIKTAKKKKKGQEKGSVRTSDLKRRTADLKVVLKETVKAQGRFYAFYMLLREVAECSLQFAGLQQMCGRADVGIVKARAYLLSANLICLPLLIWAADNIWGRVVATAILQVAEKLFDKSFVIAGVVFQIVVGESSQAATSGSVMSQFAFHAPVLVPAMLALSNPKSSIVSLLISTDKREARKRHLAAVRIQRFVRQKFRPNGKKSRSSVFWEVVLAVAREHAATPVAGVGAVALSRRCWTRCDTKQAFFLFTGTTFVVLGASLLIFVAASVHEQSLICTAAVGDAAAFLYPRVYFSDGLFGRMQCGWSHAVRLSASGAGVRSFPESKSAYQRMTKLTSIDLSHNPELVHIPASFAAIPNVEFLSLSGCSHFQGLPFALCHASDDAPPLHTLRLDGTLAQRQLNWSGQLMGLAERAEESANASTSSSQPPPLRLSSVCSSVLKSSLQQLDLSNNNFQCRPTTMLSYPRPKSTRDFVLYAGSSDAPLGAKTASSAGVCDFVAVLSPLRKLQTLDLSGNSIISLQSEFWSATSFIIMNVVNDTLTSSGITLTGNPIESMEVSGWPASFVERILRGLGRDRIRLRALSLGLITGVADDMFDIIQQFPGLREIEMLSLSRVKVRKDYRPPKFRRLKTLWLTRADPDKTFGYEKAWFSSLDQLEHLLIWRVGWDESVRINSATDFAVSSNLRVLTISCVDLDGGNNATGFLKNLGHLERLILLCTDTESRKIGLCGANSSAILQKWGLDVSRTELLIGNMIEDRDAPDSYSDLDGEAWTEYGENMKAQQSKSCSR
jgi:hypothetical protein